MDAMGVLSGRLTLELTSASLEELLTELNRLGIILSNVERQDDLTVICIVSESDYTKLQSCVLQRGDRVTIKKKTGISGMIIGFWHRPVFLCCIFLILLSSVILPYFVLFVEIEGNDTVPEALILEKAEACGISFGTSRKEIRSESVKNMLLAMIQQLEWTGINTRGCTAVISVRERPLPFQEGASETAGSIIASKDGVVTKCTVQKGNRLCEVGDAVKAGQVLVSGYTDCGIYIRATGAEAEVLAETAYDITAVVPHIQLTRGSTLTSKTKYSLLIGKKLINLTQDSGISDSSCVKIYDSSLLTLPGGFQLPVGIIRVTEMSCEFRSVASAQEYDLGWGRKYIEEYLETQMVSGKVLTADYTDEQRDGASILSVHFSCSEMIGRLKNEEIVKQHE